MRVRNWAEIEIQFLKDNFLHKTHEEIGLILNRTRNAVRDRCSKLGLVNKTDDWTETQIKELQELYKSVQFSDELNLDFIAEKFGKLKSNICRKAKELKLTNQSRPKKSIKKTKKNMFSNNEDRTQYKRKITSKWIADNGHPKGMLGKKHSNESLKKISDASKKNWKGYSVEKIEEITIKTAKTKDIRGNRHSMNRSNASWGAAWREIGGIRKYYRSKWEANYARYLEWLKTKGEILEWKREPETFWFDGIKRGCLSYLPDFRVVENNGSIAYHEVKGWMDDRSKTKIKRMAKYHPNVKLIVIDSKGYAALKKTMQPIIKDWETDAKGR